MRFPGGLLLPLLLVGIGSAGPEGDDVVRRIEELRSESYAIREAATQALLEAAAADPAVEERIRARYAGETDEEARLRMERILRGAGIERAVSGLPEGVREMVSRGLSASDERDRRAALQEIHGLAGAEGVHLWVLANDSSPQLRYQAMLSVIAAGGEVAPRGEEGIRAFVRDRSVPESTRQSAISRLLQHDAGWVVPWALETVRDASEPSRVRWACVNLLRGESSGALRPVVLGLLGRDPEEDPDALRIACQMATVLPVQGMEEPLLRIASSPAIDEEIRLQAVTALGTIDSEASTEALLSLLDPEVDVSLRLLAAARLVPREGYGERAREVMESVLADDTLDPGVRGEAFRYLLAPLPAGEASTRLREVVAGHPDTEIRILALAERVNRERPEVCAEDLTRILRDETAPSALRGCAASGLLRIGFPRTREELVGVLESIGPDDRVLRLHVLHTLLSRGDRSLLAEYVPLLDDADPVDIRVYPMPLPHGWREIRIDGGREIAFNAFRLWSGTAWSGEPTPEIPDEAAFWRAWWEANR